ncbi:MAG TPA: SDR family oxidoreductase [Candidatus Thermoplasmatota archaeon]|nr:SDR family oxidoreductase [Candidatus Thermoplasmatota archaeon]
MDKRVAIVTGANHGIGLEVARGLVAQGYRTVLAVRDLEKGRAAAEEIGGGTVMRLDLAELACVREFATEFHLHFEQLHLLVNNAGIHTAKRETTPDGIERTLATNHVGHFLLTKLLLPTLTRSAPSRIVNVASEAHRGAPFFDFDDPMGEHAWSGLRAYAQSKLANLMFTYALARRLHGTGVVANAVHPGSVRTGWARGEESGVFRLGVALASPFLLSPARGARTPLHVATAPELARVSGQYFARMRLKASSAASRDVAAQERLWELSERLTKAA